MIEETRLEFKELSQRAIRLAFLQDYLMPGDDIFVQPLTGFVTSSKRMMEDEVVSFWSDSIFPDSSIESYSGHFPFAQSRLLYVIETIVQFVEIDIKSKLHWADFATGEGVLLQLLSKLYPNIELSATEHSSRLVSDLKKKGFSVEQRSLGIHLEESGLNLSDISTLTWTLANAINPLAVLEDVVAHTKEGGYVCVAESSRILVPFRKSLRDYFSSKLPADIHPSNFSANTLRCLMQLSGLEISYINRYFDSDVLLVIGKKVRNPVAPTFYDDPNRVIKYFQVWDEQTRYFETIR